MIAHLPKRPHVPPPLGTAKPPRVLRNPMVDRAREDWLDVAASADVRSGHAHVVSVGDVPIALVRAADGALFALQNVCPHKGGPVGEGRVADGTITCPWHGWRFRLESGENVRNPAASVRTFHVREEGGRVLLKPTPG